MKEEDIVDVLPSIYIARLFYSYGRMNDLVECGFKEADNDYYEMFWELIQTVPDFVSCDFDVVTGVTKWYFSFTDMMEYYRLCRVYSRLRGLALKENPFMTDAMRFVQEAMDLDGYYGYGWTLQTRINHRWASGIVFRVDEDFTGEYELLEAVLSLSDWYSRHLEQLRLAIEEEKERAANGMEEKAA